MQQWLFFSKGKLINPADDLGIDGWFVDVFTEKNKLAPSKHGVTCVFDKFGGLDKFWSEFYFLFELTPSEKKIYKTKKPNFDLMMKKSGTQVMLHVKHPTDNTIEYKSDKFYRKNAKKKYEEDAEFKQWFDYAVQLSVDVRITNGIFKHDMTGEQTPIQEAGLASEATLAEQVADATLGNVPAETNEGPTEEDNCFIPEPPPVDEVNDDIYQPVLS